MWAGAAQQKLVNVNFCQTGWLSSISKLMSSSWTVYFALLLSVCIALVSMPLLSAAAAGSSTRTVQEDHQCSKCRRWFSYRYLHFYHEPSCLTKVRVPVAPVPIGNTAQTTRPQCTQDPTQQPELYHEDEDVDVHVPASNAAAEADDLARCVDGSSARAACCSSDAPAPHYMSATAAKDDEVPLTVTEEADAFLVQHLPGSRLQQYLDIFKRRPGESYIPTILNAKKLASSVAERSLGPGFEHIDIRPMLGMDDRTHPQPIIVSVRKDPMLVVRQLIKQCPVGSFQKFAKPAYKNGSRCYNEFWTAQKWERVQAECGDKHPILWLVLWSDKASFDHMSRSKGHPLTISVANTTVEYQRTSEGCRVLAMLPEIKPLQGEKVKSPYSPSFVDRKHRVLQVAMQVAIQKLKRACNELPLVEWPDGSCDHCRVRLAAYLADLEEQWDLLALKHSGAEFTDIEFLIHKSQITDVSKLLSSFPRRTELDHQQVYYRYLHSSRRGAHSQEQKDAKAALAARSMKPYQVALWGFGPNNNIYTCFPVDRLHQDHNGVSKHLLEALEAYLQHEYGASRAAEMLSLVNHRLAQMRPLHEAFYPSDGLAAEIAMAEERRGLMKFLPVACYGLVEQTVVDLLADYARWQHVRDSPTHTEESLLMLERWSDELVGKIKQTLGHVKNFDIPKMLNMRKYANSIREFGMIALADTGPRERMNKDLRATYNATNKKLSGLTQQVADKLHVKEAIKWNAAAIEAQRTATVKAVGARQRALATFEASISSQGRNFRFAKLADVNSWEYKAVDAVPELEHLQAAVQGFLESDKPPSIIIIKSTLGIVRYEGVADIVRGHPVLTGRQHNCMTLDSIAFRGLWPDPVTLNDVEGVWYGQVFALGTVSNKDFVFIRNYAAPQDVNDQDDRRCPLTLRPLIWEPTPRAAHGSKRKKVNKTPGSFAAIPIDSILHKVCVVPDYSRNPEQDFLINDLVHTISEDLLVWSD